MMSKNYSFEDKYNQRIEPIVEDPINMTIEPKPKSVMTSTKRTSKVLDGYYLNLRKDPSLESAIITLLSPGTKLTVESENNGWAKVKAPNGKFGYVVTDYISK